MRDEFVVAMKMKNMTEKQQTQAVMEARNIIKKIRPNGRVVVGIEKKGAK